MVVQSGYGQRVWTRCSDGLPADSVLSLTTIGSTLFAGTKNTGVYTSVDYGKSWMPMVMDNAFKNSPVWSMASLDTFLFVGLRGGGVFRTSLHGTVWEPMNNGIVKTSKIVQDIIAVGTKLYVATFGGGVLVSSDYGGSWSPLYEHQGMDDRRIYSLTGNSKYLYAGTAGVNTTMPDTGVAFVTPHGGTSWQVINNGFVRNGAHLEGVFAMCATDSLVFAGTDDVGIFRSDNNGKEWKQIAGTNLNGDIHAIAMIGKNIFYGTLHGGIYSSDDSGMNFTSNRAGLSFQNTTIPYLVKDFTVVHDTIYAATSIGVFKQTVPSAVSVVSQEQTAERCPNLHIAPTQHSLEITLCVPSACDGEISLFTSMGQSVGTSHRVHLTPGIHHHRIETDGLLHGAYFIQFKGLQTILTAGWIVFPY